MKLFICFGFILLLASYSGAETYSWVDDNGTYNFTEDLSSVPPKYRKNANRLGDMGKELGSQVSAPPEKKPEQPKIPAVQPDSSPVADTLLFNGKSHAAWLQEFAALEAELKALEQRMEQLKKQAVNQPMLTGEQYAVLKRDFDDVKVAYDQKYKVYSALIESARSAGLTVNMKK